MKVPTLADARKLNLVPSVTTILKILHKQALVDWQIEQAVLAVVTTPRLEGEKDDAFIERVLHTERVQDEESQIARDRGTDIHAALESLFNGQPISPDIDPWVRPAFEAISAFGKVSATEKILVGDGYAGKTDLIQDCPDCWRIWDFKSTKKLPDKGAWPEHRLQLAAYAQAYKLEIQEWRLLTSVCYISTVEQGKFVIFENEDWLDTYQNGFEPLVKHWSWMTGYEPA